MYDYIWGDTTYLIFLYGILISPFVSSFDQSMRSIFFNLYLCCYFIFISFFNNWKNFKLKNYWTHTGWIKNRGQRLTDFFNY